MPCILSSAHLLSCPKQEPRYHNPPNYSKCVLPKQSVYLSFNPYPFGYKNMDNEVIFFFSIINLSFTLNIIQQSQFSSLNTMHDQNIKYENTGPNVDFENDILQFSGHVVRSMTLRSRGRDLFYHRVHRVPCNAQQR